MLAEEKNNNNKIIASFWHHSGFCSPSFSLSLFSWPLRICMHMDIAKDLAYWDVTGIECRRSCCSGEVYTVCTSYCPSTLSLCFGSCGNHSLHTHAQCTAILFFTNACSELFVHLSPWPPLPLLRVFSLHPIALGTAISSALLDFQRRFLFAIIRDANVSAASRFTTFFFSLNFTT